MLAILTTHPVPYQIPIWKALAKDARVPFEVWFLTHHGVEPSFDSGFGKTFSWDINLLSGYDSILLPNGLAELPDGFLGLKLNNNFGDMLKKRKITALWVQGWNVMAYWQAIWQAEAAGIPVWLRGESNDLAPVPYIKGAIKRIMLGQLFKRVDKFLCIGKANKRLYMNYNVPLEKLYSAPYCVENERFAQQSEKLLPERADIRSAWNISPNAYCILFVGKFSSKKRPFDIVQAVKSKRLQGLQRPIHLIFTGSGELGNQLRESCNVVFDAENPEKKRADGNEDLPMASFVGFLNQTEISKAYVSADCKVLPSNYGETWGLVVNEALASGLPCAVSSACGCGEDIITPTNAKLRFKLGDTEGIARAILELYTQNYSPIKVQSQVERYGIGESVKTVVALYNEMERNDYHALP